MRNLPQIPADILYPVTITAFWGLILLLAIIIVFACIRHFRNNQIQSRMEALIPEFKSLIERGRRELFDAGEIRRIINKDNFEYFERHLRNTVCALEPLDVSVERRIADISGFAEAERQRAKRTRKWKQATALRTLSYLRDPKDIPLFRDVLKTADFYPCAHMAAIGLSLCDDIASIHDIIHGVFRTDEPNRDMLITVLFPLAKTGAAEMHRLLADPDHHGAITCVLIDLLRETGYKPVKPALNDLLKTSTDAEVRIHAIEALGMLGDSATGDALLPYLLDEDFRLRLKAVTAVARLKGDAALSEIEKHLYDLNWWVRRTSAEAIYRMGECGVRRLEELSENAGGFTADIARLILAEARFGRLRGEIRIV